MLRLLVRAALLGLVTAWCGGCGGLVLTVEDTVLPMAAHEALLTAHVQREPVLGLRQGVAGVRVEFTAGGRVVGFAYTAENGRAEAECPLPDGAESVEARAAVGETYLHGAAEVFRWDPQRVIIAVDVDKTLSRTDKDRLYLDARDVRSAPLDGAAETLRGLAADYHVIYFTARALFLLEKTRRWLEENEFPAGPVVTAPRLRDMLRDASYKTRALATLRAAWPNLLIGIGDKLADTQVYGANQMLTLIVGPSRPAAFPPNAIILPDWAAVAAFFAENRVTLSDPERLRPVIAGEASLQERVRPWMKQ